jgi:ubiquinone/menaquinone biosynthesis C-methylase UbiE
MDMPETRAEDAGRLARRRLAWTRFWGQGPLHSLGTSFAGNYADAIGTFWQGEFASCALSDSILDIGCGNGPLARILLDLYPAEGPTLTGIDLANPRATWVAKLPEATAKRLQFRGGVLAEELPFPDASFDQVVSQFGLEYSDLSRSGTEAMRVLRPTGRLALVVHHAQSLPVYVSRQELRHLAFIDRSGFLERAAAMIPFIARLSDPGSQASLQSDPKAVEARRDFDSAQAEIRRRVDDEAIPDLLTDVQIVVQDCFRTAVADGVPSALGRLSGYRISLEDSRLRFEDLVQSALDETGIRALQDGLISSKGGGAQASLRVLHVNDQVFGWALRIS